MISFKQFVESVSGRLYRKKYGKEPSKKIENIGLFGEKTNNSIEEFRLKDGTARVCHATGRMTVKWNNGRHENWGGQHTKNMYNTNTLLKGHLEAIQRWQED